MKKGFFILILCFVSRFVFAQLPTPAISSHAVSTPVLFSNDPSVTFTDNFVITNCCTITTPVTGIKEGFVIGSDIFVRTSTEVLQYRTSWSTIFSSTTQIADFEKIGTTLVLLTTGGSISLKTPSDLEFVFAGTSASGSSTASHIVITDETTQEFLVLHSGGCPTFSKNRIVGQFIESSVENLGYWLHAVIDVSGPYFCALVSDATNLYKKVFRVTSLGFPESLFEVGNVTQLAAHDNGVLCTALEDSTNVFQDSWVAPKKVSGVFFYDYSKNCFQGIGSVYASAGDMHDLARFGDKVLMSLNNIEFVSPASGFGTGGWFTGIVEMDFGPATSIQNDNEEMTKDIVFSGGMNTLIIESEYGIDKFSLLDAGGRGVLTGPANEHHGEITISGLSDGIYIAYGKDFRGSEKIKRVLIQNGQVLNL